MGRQPEIQCQEIRHEGDHKGHRRQGWLSGLSHQKRQPVTYIFAKDDIADSGEYSSTLSHELLEMIADPGVNLYAIGKFRDGGRKKSGLYGLEVCDPVEANYYKIDGVTVSDFVRPEWFE